MKKKVRGVGVAVLNERIDSPVVVVVGIEMKAEITSMVALRYWVLVGLASIVVRIVVNLIVVAVVDAAVVVETLVVEGPTTVVQVVTVVHDAVVVAVHSVVVDVIVAVSAIE